MLIVVMTAAAVAVGWGEAHHGKRFASGHWVLFACATVASSGAFFLPALAYVGGFYGQKQHARQRNRPNTTAATPPAHPPTRMLTPAPQHPQTPAAAAVVPVVAGGYFGVNAHGAVVAASPRGAALVIGPPGSGKTQSVIMPSVAYAPGAVVSTSMKTEVLAATHVARTRECPQGTRRCRRPRDRRP